MAFTAVTTVRLEDRDPAEGQKFLNEWLIPRLRATPGFLGARFLRSLDGTTGVGAVTFDTESSTRAALDAQTAMDRPAEAPKIETTAIYEVVVEV